jgi:hypothetical protein
MKEQYIRKVKLRQDIQDWEDALYEPKEHGKVRKVRSHLSTEDRILMFEMIKKLKAKLKP